MKWITRLLALFIVLPAIELALLLQFHAWTGFWATVALILGTGIAGSLLARREGMQAWRRLQDKLRRAEIPDAELIDGVIILVAGALLVTPGLLTDVAGFVGLLPPTRRLLRRAVEKKLRASTRVFVAGGPLPDVPAGEGWQGQPADLPRHAQNGSGG